MSSEREVDLLLCARPLLPVPPRPEKDLKKGVRAGETATMLPWSEPVLSGLPTTYCSPEEMLKGASESSRETDCTDDSEGLAERLKLSFEKKEAAPCVSQRERGDLTLTWLAAFQLASDGTRRGCVERGLGEIGVCEREREGRVSVR